MEVNGDLESGVGSSTSIQEESSNPRSGSTDHNLPLTSEEVADGAIDKGFPSTTRTMKEEAGSRPGKDCICDGSEGRGLPHIELVDFVQSQIGLLLGIIGGSLLMNQGVQMVQKSTPVHQRKRHRREVKESFVGGGLQESIDKEEAIVIDLVLSGIWDSPMAKLEPEIITDLGSKLQPESVGLGGEAVLENGDKQ